MSIFTTARATLFSLCATVSLVTALTVIMTPPVV